MSLVVRQRVKEIVDKIGKKHFNVSDVRTEYDKKYDPLSFRDAHKINYAINRLKAQGHIIATSNNSKKPNYILNKDSSNFDLRKKREILQEKIKTLNQELAEIEKLLGLKITT